MDPGPRLPAWLPTSNHCKEIVDGGDGGVVALEVRLSARVDERDVVHLKWPRDAIGADLCDAALINTGSQACRRQDEIAVVPAALLGP